MTHDTNCARRTAPLAAATLAALLLAGCSSGHIGESWQCPLAEGGSCDSVAAVDPAVPDPDAARSTVLSDPLWRIRTDGRVETPAAPSCAADCGPGFDPFGWLARLFGEADSADAGDRAGPDETAAGPAGSATESGSAFGGAVREADAAASLPAPAKRNSRPEDTGATVLPGEPGPAPNDPLAEDRLADDPVAGDPFQDDLRTGEIVARIWIAPFVDANGVYREASHVRVVLEPAGWRIP